MPFIFGFISLMWFRHWQSLVKTMNWRFLCNISPCLVTVSAEGTLVLISVALLMRKPLLFIKQWRLLFDLDFIDFYFLWFHLEQDLTQSISCKNSHSKMNSPACLSIFNIFPCICSLPGPPDEYFWLPMLLLLKNMQPMHSICCINYHAKMKRAEVFMTRQSPWDIFLVKTCIICWYWFVAFYLWWICCFLFQYIILYIEFIFTHLDIGPLKFFHLSKLCDVMGKFWVAWWIALGTET